MALRCSLILKATFLSYKTQLSDYQYITHSLFGGYIDAATSMSESCGGGGGSAPESGWGKKDDEDNRLYARRCLQMAHSMITHKPRQRGYQR